jgi:acetylornithine/succinyldiaminopimelate/putrescine aminotransferase
VTTQTSQRSREAILDLAERYVCPNRVRTLTALGVDLVIGRREGYRLWDVDGREYVDVHLNGGVFNLGHRNPELVDVLVDALATLDIGNHHFPSAERALLAEALVRLTPGAHYAVFASGGGEAVDLARKSARRATGRRRVVSVSGAYHGHTGLALAAGDERAAASFLSEGAPGEFVHVGYDDLTALERELATGDVAAVVLETVPATVGFPVPAPDYLRGCTCATRPARSRGRRGADCLAAPARSASARRRGARRRVCGKGLSAAVPDRGDAAVRALGAGWRTTAGASVDFGGPARLPRRPRRRRHRPALDTRG